jgi:hypothetical protein
VTQGDHVYVNLAGELLPVILDGALPRHGRVTLLRLYDAGAAVGYPVDVVHDLARLPAIAPVDDGVVEGFVLIEGQPVPLLAWPRTVMAPAKRRRRA